MLNQDNYFFQSKIGGREENQDAALAEILDNGWFIGVVCDGMGGLSGGKIASTLACNEINSCFREVTTLETNPYYILERAIQKANNSILDFAFQKGINRMGTTIAALVLTSEKAIIAHVGDSRVYQTRGGKKIYRTTDHSKVMDAVQKGLMTEEQARVSEDSNKLTKALGLKPNIEIEIKEILYKKGDVFIICSDGVWGVKPESVWLSELLNDNNNLQKNVEWYINKLDEEANKEFEGEHDNLTLLMVRTQQNSKKAALSIDKYLLMAGIIITIIGVIWIGVKIWGKSDKSNSTSSTSTTQVDTVNTPPNKNSKNMPDTSKTPEKKEIRNDSIIENIENDKAKLAQENAHLRKEKQKLQDELKRQKELKPKEAEVNKEKLLTPVLPIENKPKSETPQPKNYVVQKGEGLKKIAAKLEIDLRKLLDCNPQIKNPDEIQEGVEIKLPPCN